MTGIDWDKHLLAPLEQVFADDAEYRPKNGSVYAIAGVYDRAYTQEVEPLDSDDPSINTTHPVLGVRDALFRGRPVQGDRVYIYKEQAVFIVADVQPDSHGSSKLVLNLCKD